MALTAMRHMEAEGSGNAVPAMCLGAGQGMAVLIDRA
jgi:acetyl-CoA acetyltransferase